MDTDGNLHIGKKIKAVLNTRGNNACWLAERIPCERSNVYNIFKRRNIGTDLLFRISEVLEHDFFSDLSEAYRRTARPD